VIAVAAAPAAVAGKQGAWIAAMEPWSSLGYGAAGLSRFLRRSARAGGVLVAREIAARERVVAVVAVQDGVLLGRFVSLLAVRPDAAGRGIGRALLARVEAQTARKRRWLFVSADASNRAALGFYRKLGFVRVGRLPDLVAEGRVEILLRKRVQAAR
jgi:ribosomal protein S18 acetylase RimI-like enzyme